MSDYKCKCGNEKDFFIEHNLSQCGLYCGECGKWQKWLNKDEERLFKHKQYLANHDKQIRDEVIDDFTEKISLEISESIIWGILADWHNNDNMNDTSDKIVDYIIETSKEIAEQLKVGGENEN